MNDKLIKKRQQTATAGKNKCERTSKREREKKINETEINYQIFIGAAVPVCFTGVEKEFDGVGQFQNLLSIRHQCWSFIFLSHQIKAGQKLWEFGMQSTNDFKVGSSRIIARQFSGRINTFRANERWIFTLKFFQCFAVNGQCIVFGVFFPIQIVKLYKLKAHRSKTPTDSCMNRRKKGQNKLIASD